MSTYHNYGDASFFYGGYVISEDSKDAYRIIACDATYDGYYHLMDARIPKDSLCINTDWMNSDVVADYVDFHGSRQSPEFAYACLQYYGPKKFGGEVYLMKKEDVIEYMNKLAFYNYFPDGKPWLRLN